MTKLILEWFSDPGHEWLKVHVITVRELKVAHKLSEYSYLSPKGDYYYLEGDCDAATFINAWESKGGTIEFKYNNSNGYSPIRDMRRLPVFKAA